jgi:hypothetical protein
MNVEKGKGMLSIKADLIACKNSGIIFVDKEIATLEEDEPFSIYYVYKPSQHSKVNAFPVPIHQYHLASHYGIETYFKEYYSECAVEDIKFEGYDKKNVYIGTKYAWYYKEN